MRFRTCALLVGALLATGGRVQASTHIEREFRYAPGSVSVAQRDGYTQVDAPRSLREFRAGHPDLPWLSERVDLPPGMKVTAVTVLELANEPLAADAHLAPAIHPVPGSGPLERSAPDAAIYASPAPQPAVPVELGAQGGLRGRNVAYLQVAPARWNPGTGALERVTRVRVQLTLEPSAETGLTRERIVREWEDEGVPPGPPTRAFGASIVSATPAAGQPAQPFRPLQVPSVLGSPVAYLIVTNDAMAPAFQQLADWKTQSGVPAVVRTMSFILAQYPSAADDAERIRMFLRDAYTRWGTKWVLLGGDTDVIPERQAYTTFYTPGGELLACDMYFSCLDGNWNADGDSLFGEGFISSSNPGDDCDLLPEVYVGRAPVTTLADAQVFVNKTLQYEKTPAGGYEDRWFFFSEVLFPQNWQPPQVTQLDGAELSDSLLKYTDLTPALQVVRAYENYTDIRWRPGSVPEHLQAVKDSLNRGWGLALHTGHGYRNVMEVGDGSLINSDALALTNGNKLFNLYAIDCTSNAIDFPCIGEAFMLNPHGGAVTVVGSTRFDFPAVGRQYQSEYFRLFFHDSVSAVGELQARQKLPFVSFSSYDLSNRWTQFTLLELGDPELRMWNGAWRTLSVVRPASIALSDTQFTVNVAISGTPLYGARVTAYRAGDDFRTGLTDGAGNVTLPFRPDSVGSFVLTVTAYNSKPYQGTIAITAASAPVLVEGAITIDDDNLGGTSGDSNGSMDAGEVVDLRIPIINRGGATATGLTATLTTTDPLLTIVTPTLAYPNAAAGATVNAAGGFRVSTLDTVPDQREFPLVLVILDGAAHVYREPFQLTLHARELRTYAHVESEPVGNGNGRPEVGETVNYAIAVRNNGTATAHTVTAKLRSYDGLATVKDSTSAFGDIAPGAIVTGDVVQFQPTSANARLTLLLYDNFGLRGTQVLDLASPDVPSSLAGNGAATSVTLTWAHAADGDLFGYNIYRSLSAGGPFAKVNPVPTGRTSYFNDANLAPLTRYYYKVSAVDSSGNESALSTGGDASTNAPLHSIFPVPTGRNTPSSVALEHIYSPTQLDIVAGSDVLYLLHPDGTAPVDADGQGTTLGDFSVRGRYYAAGPSVAELDPAQGWSVIGPTWDSTSVYVFDKAGQVRAGWPFNAGVPIWSSAACGDLDGDGKLELAFGTNSSNFDVLRSDGTEWIDGDANPSTKGVFSLVGGSFNYGTPAMADLDGDGLPEIVYGSSDAKLHAWKSNGSELPGFPVTLKGQITASVAVGFLDGPGDATPEIVVASNAPGIVNGDSVYVFEPDGSRRPGWPVMVPMSGTSKAPSPAIADMNNDSYNDVVAQSTDGTVYVFNRTGTPLPGLSGARFSTLLTAATECSPVVADINGDGFNDIVCGDENGQLTAISGLTGTLLPGFPIQLGAEVRGTPAVADIDGDGQTEIVVADWDRNIYVWDYNFAFQPNGRAPWPQFHHDARRTGYSEAPLFVGVPGGPGDGAAEVKALEFAPPAPNPAQAASRMWFGIPASLGGAGYELSIYDLNGRRVRRVDSGIARAGRITLAWDLRDDSARPVGGGVYFARFRVGTQFVTRKLAVIR